MSLASCAPDNIFAKLGRCLLFARISSDERVGLSCHHSSSRCVVEGFDGQKVRSGRRWRITSRLERSISYLSCLIIILPLHGFFYFCVFWNLAAGWATSSFATCWPVCCSSKASLTSVLGIRQGATYSPQSRISFFNCFIQSLLFIRFCMLFFCDITFSSRLEICFPSSP